VTDDPRQQILCTFTRFRDQSAQNKRHYPCWQFTCLGSEARRPPYRMNQIRILSQRKGGFGILRVAMTALVFVGPRYNSVRKPAVSARFSEVNRAVSSVVERLVYTERVGGSNPSPPSFQIADCRLPICNLRLDTSRKHMSDCCFDMDLCCVEKWHAVMNGITKN
jgi:hypothetical protein